MLFAAFWSAVNRGLRPRGTLYFLVSKVARKPRRCRGCFVPFFRKSTDRSLRLVLFAAFWSAKSGAKTDPPTKKAKRRGLTLAPGDYSRVCKQTVPSARAFSPHLSERLFCQAGVVRRGTRREGCVRDKQKAQKPTIAPGSGFKPPHSRLQRNKNNRQPACPEREAGKGVRRRGQTACCLPSRHSLYGACFCAVKSCSCCARSTRAGGCSRESDMRMVLALLTSLRSFSSF